MQRLRRTVAVSVLLLSGGTVLARAGQDPGVSLPRAAVTVAPALAPADSAGGVVGQVTAQPTAAVAQAAPAAPTTLPTGVATSALPAGAQPTATAVPSAGSGATHPVAIPSVTFATTGKVVRFSVEVEGGLPVDSTEFATVVAHTLADARGWQTQDRVRFVPVSPEQLAAHAAVDVRVTLASPSLTAKLCAPLDVAEQEVSCWNGHQAVLNLQRWIKGADSYGSDLASYRTYLVNHEVGHGLGHGHVMCNAAGHPAGVMMQQTLGLGGCTAWPWPTKP